MNALASRIMLLWGWKRHLTTMIAGALSALSLPPYSFPLVLFITFPVLVWLIDGALDGKADRRRTNVIWPAFMTGWWFGFGYFLVGLNWIGQAFLVEQDVFGWMMPLAIVALPAGLALFFGLGTALARLFWSESVLRIFALALGLGAVEWLRGHILTGFPWNLIGYALTVYDWPMQAASIFGVYGLTVIAILIFAAPATLGDEQPKMLPTVLSLATLAGLVGYGAYRLGSVDEMEMTDIRLRLVQANVAQAEKWKPENRTRIFADYMSLSGQDSPDDATDPVDAIIWPESATPFYLDSQPDALIAIASLLPIGQMLITGSNRIDGEGMTSKVFNSVMALDDSGRVRERYDKMRLVPFGESLPFEDLLTQIGLRKLVTLPGSFQAGDRSETLSFGRLPPVRILICYEAIFSGSIIGDGPRPQWILNVTNDAWFGDSAGPRQHLHHARLRAVEEGLPLARAANTGISAVIDPFGRIAGTIGLNQRGILDAPLPAPLPMTIFGKVGLWMLPGLLGFCFFAAILGQFVSRRRRMHLT